MDSCPTNNKTIQERSLKKNCQKHGFCQEDPLVYHCVRYENSLAEVCAPKGLITGKCIITQIMVDICPIACITVFHIKWQRNYEKSQRTSSHCYCNRRPAYLSKEQEMLEKHKYLQVQHSKGLHICNEAIICS